MRFKSQSENVTKTHLKGKETSKKIYKKAWNYSF